MMGAAIPEVRSGPIVISWPPRGFLTSIRAPESPVGLLALFSTSAMDFSVIKECLSDSWLMAHAVRTVTFKDSHR